MTLSSGMDNIIAALEHNDRVCRVSLLNLAGWQLEEVLSAMQMPFPKLTDLRLFSDGETLRIIPGSFLGGSAPRLQYFELSGIPFPGLPKLLLSTDHLVGLKLSNIPHSGYISPEAMVALLSVLSSLESLSLEFKFPQFGPDGWECRPPSPLHSVIPQAALTSFRFKGVAEYLEDLVTFIDAPQLDDVHITFFNQIDFDCFRLAQFIDRTPTLRAREEAHVQFDDSTASVKLRYRTPNSSFGDLLINISCREPDWQFSSIEQVCSSLHPLSMVEDLYIEYKYSELVWKDDAIEKVLWLQLLLPFTAVISLYVSEEFAPGIAVSLQGLVGIEITEVLPSLQNIFVEGFEPLGPFRENIGQFFTARQLSDHPITISDWDRDFNMELM